MIQSLLVPLDGSEFSEYALPHAVAIARSAGASLHLAHVHVPNPPTHLLQATQFYYEGMTMEEYEEDRRVEERGYLEKLAGDLSPQLGSEPVPALLEGGIAQAIERHAAAVEADLIVMTTHGRTGFSRTWVGSVADELVRHTRFPVLLIPPTEGEPDILSEVEIDHILIPLDGSSRAEGILDRAVALAMATAARITLLSVVAADVSLGTRMIPFPAGHLRERHHRAQEYLEAVASRLGEGSISAEVQVLEHTIPARAILAAAHEAGADVIALATHGYRALTRAILGSVADKVLRASPIPIMIQRPST